MRQYLTKVDTREGKYTCAKKDVNVQEKICARAVRGIANEELQSGTAKGEEC